MAIAEAYRLAMVSAFMDLAPADVDDDMLDLLLDMKPEKYLDRYTFENEKCGNGHRVTVKPNDKVADRFLRMVAQSVHGRAASTLGVEAEQTRQSEFVRRS